LETFTKMTHELNAPNRQKKRQKIDGPRVDNRNEYYQIECSQPEQEHFDGNCYESFPVIKHDCFASSLFHLLSLLFKKCSF